ncbi:hypothetical protein EKO27_g2586 [Xylaria grammica]|uniref:N-acetyltransferase ESCO zinc-finger domain-containing protein n=1 Tax=Xylaria grammica TaxID=363999 RepID=A0A439DDL6_9PEZI|nr:hypothetical protein EKO27_g2586 [Xylaria grammica]
METRRRPLRTYSKRTSSTESTEPAPKRRCLASSSAPSIRDEETRLNPTEPRNGTTGSVPTPSTPLPPTKKGTITAYFSKIIPQPSAAAPSSDSPSSDLLSDSNEPTITPPSSPPVITTRKKRARRLKTRVVTQRIDENEGSDEEEENQKSGKRIGRMRASNPPADTRPPALSETTPNTLNQSDGTLRPRSEGGKRRENKMPSMQTTLSLSMSEAHYTECRECGMLYNHLHETDVKYHARRHAALRRAKARTDAQSEVVE